jgi:glutathione peroxidase
VLERTDDIFDIELTRISGQTTRLADYRGRLLMVVNVASKCGLTPHYQGMEKLYRQYRDRGLTVLGFPCNQFGGQEPGTADDIVTFCSVNYEVTFPLFAKTDVNGPGRHPLYQRLTQVPDNEGRDGDILWNFEKFLVSADGRILARFDPRVEPEDERIVKLIEDNLPA